MKYVYAFYRNILDEGKRSIPFGVIVTNGTTIAYDFDNSKNREDLIKTISETFDPLIFENFKDTFQTGFIAKGVAITTDPSGERHSIPVESEAFLDYLSSNSQGTYQYTEARTAEADEPSSLVKALMERIRIPN
jgi:hypothetical protein